MPAIKSNKVVAGLPAVLEANSIYYVRVGAGFDIYVTNSSGMIVAYPLNQSAGNPAQMVTVFLPEESTEFRQTINAPAVTPTSVVQVWLAPTLEIDENDPEWLDCTQCVAASVAAGSFDVFMKFSTPQRGPVTLNYRIV
jgi:hypothetical protein